MFAKFFIVSIICLVSIKICTNGTERKFPKSFKFGIATSAQQVEGGWDAADKGENMWDHITHKQPWLVKDRSNADVACDSYRLYKKDVQLLKDLGVDFYRFSLSWSRILPTGFPDKISKDGLQYYNNLIDELIANGITPFVTLYHWELPQPLQELGGWANPVMEKYFADYARVAFEAFGDRVQNWLTLNEPREICLLGYGMAGLAPALDMHGIAEYLCGHTLLKAHARVYHMYDEHYRKKHGRISITISSDWMEPASKSEQDIQASQRAMQFGIGWWANPIFSEEGNYPAVMRERIAIRSLAQGFGGSRLPEFTAEEVKYIRGTFDFFGLNHYTSNIVREPTSNPGFPQPSHADDVNVVMSKDPNWISSPASYWLKSVPWGFTKLLMWIKDNYENPEVIIMENGFSDLGGANDNLRVEYFHEYLNAMVNAMEQDCNISAYTAWSLMDNFEWFSGYTEYFGIYSVDRAHPEKTRTPKKSAEFYKEIIKNRSISYNV